MKKNVLVYGIISGLLISTFMLVSMAYFSYCEGSVSYETSMLVGYVSMLVAFSLVFVGIRNYRDKYNAGLISFGKAFKVGILIVLIASTIYVIAWMIDYNFFMPDFMDKYTAHALEEMRAGGSSEAEIAKESMKMSDMAEMYKNPFITALMTYAEILPVGLVVTLISALILKRKAGSQLN